MSTAFQEELKLGLTLTLGGQSFSIPGGQVKDVSVRMGTHGFTGSVTFWTSLEKADSPLFKAFQKPDLVQVRLTVAAEDPSVKPPPAPIVIQGLVRSRRLIAETHGAAKGGDRVFRRYTLEFADAAQVLWRQHRPIELHTNMSMAEVLEAHKASLQLTHDWPVLRQKLPMLTLAVGADAPGVSFYDFVLWYVDTHQGVWCYDNQNDAYLLAASKPTGQATPLSRTRVDSVNVQLPPPIRHGARVLNAVAEGPTTVALEQPQALAGVSHDVLLRTPLATEAEARQKQEKNRLQARQRRLQVSFKQFPSVDVFPGSLLRLEGPRWPQGLTGLKEDQRVLELDLEAHAVAEGRNDEQQATVANYTMRLSVRLEPADDPVPTLPPYKPPRYPIHVEGVVHSPGGEPEDRRYLIVEDEKTNLINFRMTVPLWNKTVSVPAEPIHFPGQFFFPPYKNTRVLLALHFEHAEFLRFIDWKDGVRTPMDGQGDQILLGLNKTSQTSFTHDFQDDKPVWKMQRTSGGDTQVVRMSEGHLFIQVKESQATVAKTPTYDVSPQVEAAIGDLSSSVGGAIGQVSGAFQGAVAAARAKMKSAQAETMAAISGARAELGAKVTEARSGLQGASSRLSQGTEKLSGAVADAKASLNKLR